MERHLKSLQDIKGNPNLTFIYLRDRVCHGDAHLAYHIWAACTGSGKWTCGLHLDDLDLGLLLNLICSIGVSEHNQIVTLKGSLLMSVLAISTKVRPVLSIFRMLCGHTPLRCNPHPPAHPLIGCSRRVSPSQSLAGVNCGRLDWSAPVAHDEGGNLIMLEPSLPELKLPADYPKANIPSTEQAVLTALCEGRCVLAFYRSGGVVAGQLGHHWHLVTSMDPQDIADGTVRIGAIAYPQRAAIVSATALQSQAGCSSESSASLAAELQRETNGKGQGKRGLLGQQWEVRGHGHVRGEAL